MQPIFYELYFFVYYMLIMVMPKWFILGTIFWGCQKSAQNFIFCNKQKKIVKYWLYFVYARRYSKILNFVHARSCCQKVIRLECLLECANRDPAL